MENLLDYLLYALFGHNVTGCYAHNGDGHSGLTGKTWTIIFEDRVFITLDTNDLKIIRHLYEERCEFLDDDDRRRYNKIFDLCV